MVRCILSALACFRLDKKNPICQQIFSTHVELPFTAKPICEEEKYRKEQICITFYSSGLYCIYWKMYSHAPCSIDLVETAIFDPGVAVSFPVFSVSFAVGVKDVEIAVASNVTVFLSGGFVLTDNDGDECDVEDNVATITVDDVVIVVTEDVTSVGVVIDDVGTIEVDDVAVFLTCAVDDAGAVVVDGLADEVARVSTDAVEDTITVHETGEAEGEGVTSMSPGLGQ